MSNILNSFILASVFLLAGCADLPPLPKALTPTVKRETQISVEKTFDEKIALTGKTVYVSISNEQLKTLLSGAHIAELSRNIKSYLARRGFTVVEESAKGYSTITLFGDSYQSGVPSSVGPGVTSVTTVTKDAGAVIHRLALQWDVNSFGLRQKRSASFAFASEKALDSVWEELSKAVSDNIEDLKVNPPAENKKGKGEPGCWPQLGFEAMRVLDGGHELYKVIRVKANSAAKKAGLKVGDLVEAVDSIPYAEFVAADTSDIYERRIPVPIKFSRNGEIFRSTIRAQIVCSD